MLFFLIIVTLTRTIAQDFEPNPLLIHETEENEDTAKCVLKFCSKYFAEKKALSGSIVIVNINSYVSTTQQTLLETIHKGHKLTVMVKDSAFPHKNASHFPEKAKNYMMILEEKEELERNIKQLNKLPTWNPLAKAGIYIELKPKYELDSLVKEIIDTLMKYKLMKTTVFVNFPQLGELRAYTWKPFSDKNCGGPCDEIFLMDVCKDNEITEIAPSILTIPMDMRMCPLTVYTVISEPYVMPPVGKKVNSNYDDEYEFNLGIEVNMISTLAEFANMTLVIRMSNVSDDWGYLHTNGTATGLFAKLRNNEVDVVIGNMEVNRNIRKWFDPSNTYVQDEITWCVPKAGAASTWSNLVTIFKWSTWATTLAAVIVVSFILHWFTYKERPNTTKWPTKSILMTFGMILGWGGMFKPERISFRVLVVAWLLFSINLNTSYQSFLRSFLIHPKFMKQVSTDKEIMNAHYKVGGKETLRENFKNSDVVNEYLYNYYETCSSFEACMKRVGFDRNFATAGSKRQASFQDQNLARGKSLVYCFQEGDVIYKYGVVLLFRKWFPMTTRFNGYMRSISENGLIWKWNNEVFLHHSVGGSNDMVPLGMEHMLGAFLFLFLGYSTCGIAFILEVIIYLIKNKCMKKPVKRQPSLALLEKEFGNIVYKRNFYR